MADPVVVSAGTFVGAALEQSGYIAQGQLLDALSPFFEHISTLIYFLALAAALTAIGVFGEYKLGRYLLIAPMLFWVAIVPRAELDGVVWKVGGGKERLFNYQASGEQVKEVNTTEINSQPLQTVSLALPFQFMVRIVNNIVNSAVDIVLDTGEDTSHMLFLTRAQTLSMLTNVTIDDPQLLDMYKNAMFGVSTTGSGQTTACYDFMNMALASSQPLKREDDLKKFQEDLAKMPQGPGITNSPEAYEELTRRASVLQGATEQYRQLWQKMAEDPNRQIYANVSPATIDFILAHKTFPNVQKILADNGLSGASDDDIRLKLTKLSCYELWRVIADGIYDYATKTTDTAFANFRNQWKSVNGAVDPTTVEPQLCKDLAEKMGSPVSDEYNCDLVPITYLYLVRNSLQSSELSNIAQRHTDRSQFVRYDTEERDQSVYMAGKDPDQYEFGPDGDPKSADYGKSVRYHTNEEGTTIEKQRHYNLKNGKVTDRSNIWVKDQSLGNMEGELAAAFGPSVDYDTEGLKQEVFTTIMEMPYWQGTLLYLLGVMYPFWSLWLLIPGRATHWFILPLTWLWVKSWDIGYAMVMVFEKILWNLMPPAASTSINQNSIHDIREVALPDIITEALKLDPSYNVHIYYWALSLLFTSVPTVTGALILKGRKSMLASFTGAMGDMPSRMAARASSAYGMGNMNRYLSAARQFSGAGRLNALNAGSPIAGNGALKSAVTWGTGMAVARGARAFGLDRSKSQLAQVRGLQRTLRRINGINGQIQNLDTQLGGLAAGDPRRGTLQSQRDALARTQNELGRDAMAQRNKILNGKDGWDKAAKIADAAATGLGTGTNIYEREKRYDAAFAAAYDKRSGRWSDAFMDLNAKGNMIDEGAGAASKMPGHEIDDRAVSTYNELIAVLSAKLTASTQIAQELIDAGAYQSGNLLEPGNLDPNNSLRQFLPLLARGATGAAAVGGGAAGISAAATALSEDDRNPGKYGIGDLDDEAWSYLNQLSEDSKPTSVPSETYSQRVFNTRARRKNKNPDFSIAAPEEEGFFDGMFPGDIDEVGQLFGLDREEVEKQLRDNYDKVAATYTDPLTGQAKSITVGDIFEQKQGATSPSFGSLGGGSASSKPSGSSRPTPSPTASSGVPTRTSSSAPPSGVPPTRVVNRDVGTRGGSNGKS